ncbi:AzlD domain-containing protein [Helicobacter sp. MIT 21-1697]|uniref:branched-chain amino acid transporter permease n=1 Tax=Helicobacter sp. MIT 21-1697 TaxID=2993733 RepID=UPI00224B0942|nr:AzlD domain-containing protein [Helicobacter sp. MIT 21-1697]MCX2716150.1 AzlD domain-containing protein [Helicobacter sp. MIT 21-1697]
MSPEIYHSIALIALIALNTLLSRFLPFIIFARSTPAFIVSLGKVLPSAIIAMLIIYCLKDTNLAHSPYGLNEMVSVLVVSIIHICFKIPILSIVCGTITYMALIQSAILDFLP